MSDRKQLIAKAITLLGLAGVILISVATSESRRHELLNHTTITEKMFSEHHKGYRNIKTSKSPNQNTPDPKKQQMVTADNYNNILISDEKTAILLYKNGCALCEYIFPEWNKYATKAKNIYWLDVESKEGEWLTEHFEIEHAATMVIIENKTVQKIESLLDHSKKDHNKVIEKTLEGVK